MNIYEKSDPFEEEYRALMTASDPYLSDLFGIERLLDAYEQAHRPLLPRIVWGAVVVVVLAVIVLGVVWTW